MNTNDVAALTALITTHAKVVTGGTIGHFNDNVAKATQEGWQPSGQIFIYFDAPAIMMVKYDPRVIGLIDPLVGIVRGQLASMLASMR